MSRKKMSRRVLVVLPILVCIILVVVYSHAYSAKTDLKRYAEWDEEQIQGSLKIFPDKLENMGAEKYYYKCTKGILDDGYQIYLQCRLTEEVFAEERARLSSISDAYGEEVQQIVYDEEKFIYPAYVTIYNFNGAYEYALLDQSSQTIYYIHLEFVPKKDVVFDIALMPEDYLSESSEGMDIYAHWVNEMGLWYYN